MSASSDSTSAEPAAVLNGVAEPSAAETTPLANGKASPSGVPEKFVDPLTHEVMEDPVVIESGIAFDRASITDWFGQGNATCPVSGDTVRPDVMIPLPSLKKEIAEWQGGEAPPDVEQLGEMLNQLATVTRTLSSHLASAEKLSRALSSRTGMAGDEAAANSAAPLDEVQSQVRELAKQVSKLSGDTAGEGSKLLAALGDAVRHVKGAARAAAAHVGGVVGPALAAAAHHTQAAATSVREHAGPATGEAAKRLGEAARAVRGALDAARERTGQAAGAAGHHIGNAAAAAQHHVGNAACAAQHHLRNAAGAAQHHLGPTAARVRDAAGSAAGALKYHGGAAAHKAGEAVGAAGAAIKERAGPVAAAAKAKADEGAAAVRGQWQRLPPSAKGAAKAVAIVVGYHVLARLAGHVRGGRCEDGEPREGVDVGQVLRQLQDDVGGWLEAARAQIGKAVDGTSEKVGAVAGTASKALRSGLQGKEADDAAAKPRGRDVAKKGKAASAEEDDGGLLAVLQAAAAGAKEGVGTAAGGLAGAAGGLVHSLQLTGAAAVGALLHASGQAGDAASGLLGKKPTKPVPAKGKAGRGCRQRAHDPRG